MGGRGGCILRQLLSITFSRCFQRLPELQEHVSWFASVPEKETKDLRGARRLFYYYSLQSSYPLQQWLHDACLRLKYTLSWSFIRPPGLMRFYTHCDRRWDSNILHGAQDCEATAIYTSLILQNLYKENIWSTWSGMIDAVNIFHYIKDFCFFCNELLCWSRLWGRTGLLLNSRMSQKYYCNKYLMKEDLPSIHYTVSNMCLCSLGGFPVPMFNILCLQLRVTYGETWIWSR